MVDIDKKRLMKLTKASEDIQQVLISNQLDVKEAISVLLAFTIDIAYASNIDEKDVKELYDGMWSGVKLSKEKNKTQ